MTTNHPGNSHVWFPQSTHSHLQCHEKGTPIPRHNMPPNSSSRRTLKHNPEAAQNATRPQGVPRTSNGQIAPRRSSFHRSEAQIHKMTFEQVVSSILQFLGKDPQYMASVDPNNHGQSKTQKRRQNSKVLEATDEAPKKKTQKKEANAMVIQPANNTNHQETITDGQIRPRALEMSLFSSLQPRSCIHYPGGVRPGGSRARGAKALTFSVTTTTEDP